MKKSDQKLFRIYVQQRLNIFPLALLDLEKKSYYSLHSKTLTVQILTLIFEFSVLFPRLSAIRTDELCFGNTTSPNNLKKCIVSALLYMWGSLLQWTMQRYAFMLTLKYGKQHCNEWVYSFLMGVYAGMHTLNILQRLKVISPPVGNSLTEIIHWLSVRCCQWLINVRILCGASPFWLIYVSVFMRTKIKRVLTVRSELT